MSKDEVTRIVERDLGKQDPKIAPRIFDLRPAATWRPPYVVWGASGSAGRRPAWAYSINAFTGEILSKSCTAIVMSYTSGKSPCD
jgi:hypothetical protein